MGDATSVVIMKPRPLVTSDAAALTSSIESRPLFQPAFILESGVDVENETTMPTGLTVAGDVWRIEFNLGSPMPGYVVYPFAFTGDIINDMADAAFADLFELQASMQMSVAPNLASRSGFRDFTMGTPRTTGPSGLFVQDISPELKGLPVRPRPGGGGLTGIRVGDLLLTIKTADVTATSNTTIDLDYRLLMFPEGAKDNAGFYTPLLYTHPR